MKVKNGIASSRSFDMMPKSGRAGCRGSLESKSPSSMAMKPKNRPTAASENATG